MVPTTAQIAWPPIRPRRQADEWIETYLVRIARANGRRSPTTDDISRLRRIPDQAKFETGLDARGYLSSLPAWAKKKFGSPIRYCPACFQDERIVRARWRLTKFEMCTVHHIHLKKGLVEPAISVEVNYPTAIRLNDVSDAQLWDGATCPLPAERDHALNIWEAFERNAMNQEPQAAREPLAWAIVAEQLLDAVTSCAEGPEAPLQGEARLSHGARWLNQASLTLTASQDSIVNFLISIKTHRERRAAARCLSDMIKEGERSTTLLNALPLQYLHDRLIAMAPETYCPVAQGALPLSFQPDGYVSLNYAEGMLGRDTNFVHHLVRANFFERVQKVRFGHRVFFFVARTEIEGCRRWLSDCMTPTQLKQHWDISHSVYLALRKRGILRPFVIGPWAFHRMEDITSLSIKLESAARLLTDRPKRLLPLFGSWLLGHGSAMSVFSALLDEILDGRVALFRDRSQLGLSAYYVDVAAGVRAREITYGLRSENRLHRNGGSQLRLFDSLC